VSEDRQAQTKREERWRALGIVTKIVIPFAKMRLVHLCNLLGDLDLGPGPEPRPRKDLFGDIVAVYFLRAEVRDEYVKVSDQNCLKQIIMQKEAVGQPLLAGTRRLQVLASEFFSDAERFEALPASLENAPVVPGSYDAEPDRVRQTWHFVQMMNDAVRTDRTDYVLVLEDDVRLCPGFLPFFEDRLLEQAAKSTSKTEQPSWPMVLGGFGGAGLGFPAAVVKQLGVFLKHRIRESNVDVLIMKGFDPAWAKFRDANIVEENFVRGRCVYKPAQHLLLHAGSVASTFGVVHAAAKTEIGCGTPNGPNYFVANLERTPVRAPNSFSLCF